MWEQFSDSSRDESWKREMEREMRCELVSSVELHWEPNFLVSDGGDPRSNSAIVQQCNCMPLHEENGLAESKEYSYKRYFFPWEAIINFLSNNAKWQ